MVKRIKIHTLTQLKALKVGVKLRLVSSKNKNPINEIVGVNKIGLVFSHGALTFPDKNGFESWDDGFMVKKGINTSIPTTLKYEVFK